MTSNIAEFAFSTFPASAAAALVVLVLGLGAWALANWRSEAWPDRRGLSPTSLMCLIDASSSPLAVCERGVVAAANVAFAEFFGGAPSTLVGRTVDGLFHEKDRKAVLARLEQAQSAEAPAPLRARLDADGSRWPVEVVVSAIRNDPRRRVVLAVKDLRDRFAAAEKLRRLSDHDPLTGLPMREPFESRMSELLDRLAASSTGLETEPRLALHLIDIDRLAEINETMGRSAGDEVLQRTAKILRQMRARGDLVARLGGDVFAVAQVNLAEQSRSGDGAAAAKAREICYRLAGPALMTGEVTEVSARVGYALYPGDGRTMDELIQAASHALTRAKASGRGSSCAFDPALADCARRRRRLAHDLRHALVDGSGLHLEYQPQRQLPGGRLCGFEALARWPHPDLGAVSPAEFVPIAEDGGFVALLDAWALRTACKDAAAWPQSISLAVNLSADSVVDPGLLTRVKDVLVRTGLAPRRLEFEVTESALIRDFDRARYALSGLKALGCRIAMDDFGTGYSSLYYLQAFSFDKIKIDRSFIVELETRAQSKAIVRAVAGLAHGLDLPILAEGVETQDQLRSLVRLGCDQAQGFLVGRPMSATEACARIASEARSVHVDTLEREREPLLRPAPTLPDDGQVLSLDVA